MNWISREKEGRGKKINVTVFFEHSLLNECFVSRWRGDPLLIEGLKEKAKLVLWVIQWVKSEWREDKWPWEKDEITVSLQYFFLSFWILPSNDSNWFEFQVIRFSRYLLWQSFKNFPLIFLLIFHLLGFCFCFYFSVPSFLSDFLFEEWRSLLCSQSDML